MTGRPAAHATRGMVATSHHLASAAGLHALRLGGSAVDAAIAANAVLCVVYPHMAGLGGDGFWLVHDPARGGVHGINASGPAAERATCEYYAPHAVAGEIPSRGALAALTVPGAVDGWRLAHERHGRLPWEALLADASRLARDGMPVATSLAHWLVRDAALLAAQPGLARTFAPRGAPRAGDVVVQPALADTLERLARDGPRVGFYEGETAERLCDALARDGSPLRAGDLAAYRAEWVTPISAPYRGRTVYELPPNAQGVTALQILRLLDGWDVRAWGDGSADYLHHMAEAAKLAAADRDAWLADPRAVDIPLDRLLDAAYLDERRRLVAADRAIPMADVAPGIPFPGASARRGRAGGDTCAFSVVDADGLAVSAIQSICHDFGCGVVAGDTGIVPQNRGVFFSLDPARANVLAPGRRTFHTLAPAMLFEGDRLAMAFGTMGGEGQPQTHAALVTRVVDFGHDVQRAIDAPRWLVGRTWGDESDDLWLEGRIADDVARELARRGQPVRRLDAFDDKVGHAQAIRVLESGVLEGGADPRGDGAAVGY